MNVQHFFDRTTSSLTYIVFDSHSRDAVIIDPVLDYDPASGKVEGHNLEKLHKFILEHALVPIYCLETHAHADHLSSSQFLKILFPQMKIAIGEKITQIQKAFQDILELEKTMKVDGSQFDKLIKDGEIFHAGTIKIEAIGSPGHTPACQSFLISNMLFSGDALFIEDYGTGRCDFPGGSAEDLYHSIHDKLYKLPDETIVFVGHDYQPNGRELRFETTIGVSKEQNSQLKDFTTKESFLSFRQARDKTLSAPRLLFPSLQVNIEAGKLPRFMKLPVYNKIKL